MIITAEGLAHELSKGLDEVSGEALDGGGSPAAVAAAAAAWFHKVGPEVAESYPGAEYDGAVFRTPDSVVALIHEEDGWGIPVVRPK